MRSKWGCGLIETAHLRNRAAIQSTYHYIMIIILTTALVGATAFALGKLNDPVGRELDGMRAHVELRNTMTPLFSGPKH